MTPSQFSEFLRQIACAIDASKQPDRMKVATAIRKAVEELTEEKEPLYSWTEDQEDFFNQMIRAMEKWVPKMKELVKNRDQKGIRKLLDDMKYATGMFRHHS